MRFSKLLTLATLTCGLALAADPITVNYLDGNMPNLAPASWATIQFDSDEAIDFNTGTETVAIPYSAITTVLQGKVRSFSSSDEPYYKVWHLHEHLFDRKIVQQIDLKYEDETGEPQTLSMELDRKDAKALVAQVVKQTSPYELLRRQRDWWGDSIWKTKRNAAQWESKPKLTTRD